MFRDKLSWLLVTLLEAGELQKPPGTPVMILKGAMTIGARYGRVADRASPLPRRS